MKIEIKVATQQDRLYAYPLSMQLKAQTGCIGRLRADMDTNGLGFFSSWDDYRKDLKTEGFKAEIDEVINRLRLGPKDEKGKRHLDADAFLASRDVLSAYCYKHEDALFYEGSEYYCIRVNTDEYSYIMRLNPEKGEYNLYCYCYRKNSLDSHMKNAERGIRFITPHYGELFRIPDGGQIKITYSDGYEETVSCRYIDEYHVELEDNWFNLYHICEFAERMEKYGNKVEPACEVL